MTCTCTLVSNISYRQGDIIMYQRVQYAGRQGDVHASKRLGCRHIWWFTCMYTKACIWTGWFTFICTKISKICTDRMVYIHMYQCVLNVDTKVGLHMQVPTCPIYRQTDRMVYIIITNLSYIKMNKLVNLLMYQCVQYIERQVVYMYMHQLVLCKNNQTGSLVY